MDFKYYNKKGDEISPELCNELLKDFDYKVIKYETLQDGKRVSTVWLGLDFKYREEGLPLIFETMVFPKNDYTDLDAERYSTKEEAIAGHKEMVEKWSKIDNDDN